MSETVVPGQPAHAHAAEPQHDGGDGENVVHEVGEMQHDHGMGHLPPFLAPGDPGPAVRDRLEPPLYAAYVSDVRGRVVLTRMRNPSPFGSFGYVDRFIRLSPEAGKRFAPGTLAMQIDAQTLDLVAARTLRFFRWVDGQKGWELVVRSGIGYTGDYVWAHITEAGRYAIIGVTRDPLVGRTLVVLAALDDVVDLDAEALGGRASLADGIRRLMLGNRQLRRGLADPEFAHAVGEGNARLGLPEPSVRANRAASKTRSGDPPASHDPFFARERPLRPICDVTVRHPPELDLIDPWGHRLLGRWRVVKNTPAPENVVLAMHAALLPTGKILYFGGSENVRAQHDAKLFNNTRLWDPKTETSEPLGSPPDHDLFCCGHAFLADGRLLAAGGSDGFPESGGAHPNHSIGTRKSSIFDPSTNAWTATGPLNFERGRTTGGGAWYPTLVTLPDGRVLRLTGHPEREDTRHNNSMLEIFDPASRSWSDVGKAADLPAVQVLANPGPYYPRVHVLPDGQLFFATPLRFVKDGPPLNESWRWNPVTKLWKSIGSGPNDDAYISGAETSVLLPLLPENAYQARVLLANGAQPKIIDLTRYAFAKPKPAGGASMAKYAPEWVPTAARELEGSPARFYATAVLLPDASVLVVGGGTSYERSAEADAVYAAERFEPPDDSKKTSGSWSVLASAHVPRLYHSVALLLPDGRVWTAGTDYSDLENHTPPKVNHDGRIEIYSPPYLFWGPRPTISSSPPVATVATDFDIGTPEAKNIAKVALLRCGSATHAFNPDQRYVGLVVKSRTAKKLTVAAPPTLKIAPPGYYLLFILDDRDVPSVGRFVRLQP